MSETTMVERVALAIEMATSTYEDGSLCIDWDMCARAAIEAMREPTEEMVRAGEAVDRDGSSGYRAMITAALKD